LSNERGAKKGGEKRRRWIPFHIGFRVYCKTLKKEVKRREG
jgi:hypothetical protein